MKTKFPTQLKFSLTHEASPPFRLKLIKSTGEEQPDLTSNLNGAYGAIYFLISGFETDVGPVGLGSNLRESFRYRYHISGYR